MIASPPVPKPTVPPQTHTPPKRSMIARRRWFRYWAPQITQRGYVWTRRAKVQKAARARHRTASRATAGSRPAPVPSQRLLEAARRATLSGRYTSGPTKPLAQRHGRIESMRTSWQKPRAWTRRRDPARELPAEVNAARGAFARHIVALVHAMNASYGRDRSPR